MKNGLIFNRYGHGLFEYFKDDLPHREDGPAVIDPGCYQEWWLNGERHRENGPAFVGADGSYEWWFHDKQYPFTEYVDLVFPEDSPKRTLFVLKWNGS